MKSSCLLDFMLGVLSHDRRVFANKFHMVGLVDPKEMLEDMLECF